MSQNISSAFYSIVQSLSWLQKAMSLPPQASPTSLSQGEGLLGANDEIYQKYLEIVQRQASTKALVGNLGLSSLGFVPPPLPTPVAQNQEATVTGDPHVKEADGGRFDFQGEPNKIYNLINDTGFFVNAKFQAWQGNQGITTIGEIAATVVGPSATSLIRVDPHREPPVSVNGLGIKKGETQILADGGKISFSSDGRTVTIATKEGYINTLTLQGKGATAFIDYSIKSGEQGVGRDGRLPGGLVGHTFDADSAQRNGKTGHGAQGEGAIEGIGSDYEVLNGIFGEPQPQIVKSSTPYYPTLPTGIEYQAALGLPLGTMPQLMSPEEIQDMWNQTLMGDFGNDLSTKNAASDQKTKRLQLLLQLALNSGNIDLAVLLMSGLETRMTNDVASGLMKQIQSLQEQRRQMADQMGKMGKDADPSKIQEINMKAGDIGTEISLLQTFLQDIMGEKNEAQQMGSNFIKSRHETTQSIIRNLA